MLFDGATYQRMLNTLTYANLNDSICKSLSLSRGRSSNAFIFTLL